MDDLEILKQVPEQEVEDTLATSATDSAETEIPAASGEELEPVPATLEEAEVAEAARDVEAVAEAIVEPEEVVSQAAAKVEAAAAAELEPAAETEAAAKVVARAEAIAGVLDESEAVTPAPAQAEPAGTDMATAMAEYVNDFQFKPLKAGEIRDGIIVSVSPTEILVDVGAKSEGFIHQRELERLGKEYLENLEVGQSVVVFILRPEDKDGNIVLSLSRAQQERDWREAERLLESNESFQSTIIGFNRGGVICRLGKVRGFIPASQLLTRPEGEVENEEERYASLVGQPVWLKVVELDRRRNRLILSERLAMREVRKKKKEQLLDELKKGDVRKGRVSSVAKFGAFVDLGGADGLIHLSELSWSRVNHPNEVLKVGDEVEVYVLNVDRDRKRIGLSLRRLEPEPWSVVHERYAVGQIVDGVITKLASFGAFARVDGTIEGLIHISELANHRVNHPKEVVKEGDEVSLRIIRIDPGRRRMGLSLKRVDEDEYAELDWREAPEASEDDEDVDWAEASDTSEDDEDDA